MLEFVAGAEIPPEVEKVLAAQDDPLGWIHSAELQIDRESKSGTGWTRTEQYRWTRSRDGDEVEHLAFRTSDQHPSRNLWSRRGAVLRFYEEQEIESQVLWHRGDIFPVMAPDEIPFRMEVQLVIFPLGRPNREVIQAASELRIVRQDLSGMTIEFNESKTREKIQLHFLESEGYWIDSVRSVREEGMSLPLHVRVDEFWKLGAQRLPQLVRAFRGEEEFARWRVSGRVNEDRIRPQGLLEFPPGTPIDDHINKEYHIWGNGKPKVTFPSDHERSNWLRQQSHPSSNKPHPSPRPFLFWANVVLFSLLGLIYLLRFRTSRHPVE